MRRASRLLLLAPMAICLAPSAAFAANYYVPGDFETIQAAVDAVDPGDHIYVLPGIYAGFRYNGKAVTVASLEGPNITIISGSIRFWDGESAGSRLMGFKIVTGDGDLISFSTDASGTASGYVENCILANSAYKGIAVAGSGAPQIVGVDVSACSIGIEVRDTAAPFIEDAQIHDTTGRGINVLASAYPAIYRCRLSECATEGVYYASPVCGSLDNCIIDHCGEYYGAHASAIVVGQNACLSVTNCIMDNSMRDGCELLAGSTSVITNCIATNNARHGISAVGGAAATITYTCFRNNILGDLGGGASAGTGCIYTNPRFVQAGNYHLSDPSSPCIDAGDPAIADLALPPGLGGTRSDMGAYGGAHNAWPPTLPPPTLLAPGDGATCVSSVILLDWTDVADATGYMVKIGTSCGFGTEHLVVASAYEFSGAPNVGYFWRVKTRDASGGFGNYTSCFSFETDPGPLAAPLLESPADGAMHQPLEGTLDWADVPDAAGYRVQLGTACGLGDEHDVGGSSCAYAGLEPGTTYYWRVKTLNECDAFGAYSDCFSFSTESNEPGCFVDPTVLDFGEVEVGAFADFSFVIRNTGGGTLTGTMSASCDGYSIVSGEGPYALGAAESLQVTVRFAPPAYGLYACTIETGSGLCADVACEGATPAMAVEPRDEAWTTEITHLQLIHLRPNPSRGPVTIRFSLPTACPARITVHDLSGRQVRVLAGGFLAAGPHRLEWDGLSGAGLPLAAGVYYVRLATSEKSSSKRLITVE